MVVSSRAIVTLGLGLAGFGMLASPSFGQQPDTAFRKTNRMAAAPATPSAVPSAPVIGTIDMSAVFKGYDKVKVLSEEFRAAVKAKEAEMMGLMQQMQKESEMLAKLTPGSIDFKKGENKITELKAKGEADRENAQRDFTIKEAEMMATVYKEIQNMVNAVARSKKMTYVLRVSNEPITSSDPRSALMAVERSVVFYDPANDITTLVVGHLNRVYKAAGGVAPKPGSAAAAPTSPRGN
ncbi:OmpH/Skp family outer membrane protein [Singulisphaera rosea]